MNYELTPEQDVPIDPEYSFSSKDSTFRIPIEIIFQFVLETQNHPPETSLEDERGWLFPLDDMPLCRRVTEG